jgi:hypothetical protein
MGGVCQKVAAQHSRQGNRWKTGTGVPQEITTGTTAELPTGIHFSVPLPIE